MKKIFLFLLVCWVSTFNAQDNGKAVVCLDAGSSPIVCLEIERVRIEGVWVNACCHHMQGAYTSCIDDCYAGGGPVALTHPEPPVGFQNTPSHMVMGDDHDVWIVENDELSQDLYDENSPEFLFLNERLIDFDFIDASNTVEYLTITISESKYAIMSRSTGEVLNRKKSPVFFTEELAENLDETYSLKVYPTTVVKGDIVNIRPPVEVQLIELVSLFSGSSINIEYKRRSELHYELQIPSIISGGIYALNVKYKSGFVRSKKIIIK
mgnify:FL=1